MPTEPRSLKDLFLAALSVPPEGRAAWVERSCAEDVELRRQLEQMLAAHDTPQSLLDRPMPGAGIDEGATGPVADAERLGTMIGPYKLLQQIGEGGMGTVYMAEQSQPVQRKVALKVIKPGMDSSQVVARFEAERQALAMMDHANIARVLDGGTTGSGLPYFVMELIHGIPITRYCDDNRLTPRERLELFVPVCQAIQHAHQKGIIHRDIKPSNVMVTLYDGKPVPKVIDFGVAKATEQRLTEGTLFTQYGTMVGTLEYMSPEQAEMSALGIDTRSDIYSLGVLLYELLTGGTPLSRKKLREAAYGEILRIIKEEEPQKPSTRLSDSGEALASISAQRHMEPVKLSKLMRGELDWIVMKTLEKDRNRRYETASGFAADVQRYLADETVQACPPSAGYRFRKFARRNKRGLATASLLLLVLFAGAGIAIWQAVRAARAERHALDEVAATARERDEKDAALRSAEQELATREAVLDFLENKVFAAARPKNYEGGQGYDVKLADAIKSALPFVTKSFAAQPLIEARLRMTIGKSFSYLGDAKSAAEQFHSARTLYTQLCGPDHLDTLASMNNLAASYYAAGRIEEAIKLMEETLQLRKAKQGLDHPDTLLSMNNLASTYLAANRTQEAVKLLEETLQLKKAKFGPDHPNTLLSMMSLANSYLEAGRTQEAVKLNEETLQLRIKKLGSDHPDTLASMNNLANSYVVADRTEEAIKLYEAALNLQKAKPGPDHPNTLLSMNNLAVSYTKAGRTTDALSLLKDTLARRQRRVAAEPGNSEEQASLAWTHGQIGDAEQARHDYPAAVEAFARSVAMFDKLDQAGELQQQFFRNKLNDYRQRLALCRKAEQATRDLAFALQQPAAEVPGLLYVRVRFLLKQQKLPAAVESAAKMKELAGDNGEQLYDAACAYALCAGDSHRVSAGSTAVPKPQGADATALAKKCADESMALLKQAIAKGYKDGARLKQDKDLDALRQREDFKRLLAELEPGNRKK